MSTPTSSIIRDFRAAISEVSGQEERCDVQQMPSEPVTFSDLLGHDA